jgi:hypothetical protein
MGRSTPPPLVDTNSRGKGVPVPTSNKRDWPTQRERMLAGDLDMADTP